MRTKAERRHFKKVRQEAARRMVRDAWGSRDLSLQNQMACNCDNLKMCRGACCKNPRRSGWLKAGGKTAREQLAERVARGMIE